jgi:hypothetical protein
VGYLPFFSAMTFMKYPSRKRFETKNPLASFSNIGKSCTIPITSEFCFVLKPDIIGIVHDFSLSKKLARGFSVSNFFLTHILYKSQCSENGR